MKRLKDQITPALLISVLALFVALGGGAYAALGKNSVGSKQLKKNAVTTKKIKNKAVTGAKIKKKTITGSRIKANTLGVVPEADTITGYSRFGVVKVTATDGGVDYDTAEAASPELELGSAPPFTIYAKCFNDPEGEDTYGITYIKTSENGAILDADEDTLDGDSDFLDVDTEEQRRELMYDDVGDNEATFYGMHSNEAIAISAGGVAIEAHTSIAVKRGNLEDGNGLYGPGNVCIFTGDLTVTSD